MKTLIALVRDHSASMALLAPAAAADFNSTVTSIRDNAIATAQDTLLSVVELGVGFTGSVRPVVEHASVTRDLTLTRYDATGYSTPLYDGVAEAIELLERHPAAAAPDTALLVIVTTDGEENSSKRWNALRLADRMRRLTATDRWSFVFRVPARAAAELIRNGIPAQNVLTWDPAKGAAEVAYTAAVTASSMDTYYAGRSLGLTNTTKFFADLSEVRSADVEAALTDISRHVALWPVSKAEPSYEIRPFAEGRLNRVMQKGAAFYQLSKSELIQSYKVIAVRDKTSNAVYAGAAARNLLNVPTQGTIRLAPSKVGSNFDVFIQSTSVNRKLVPGTQVLYWEGANAGAL